MQLKRNWRLTSKIIFVKEFINKKILKIMHISVINSLCSQHFNSLFCWVCLKLRHPSSEKKAEYLKSRQGIYNEVKFSFV